MKRAGILIVFVVAVVMILATAMVSFSAHGPSNNTTGSGSGTWQDTAVVPLSVNSQLSLGSQMVDRNAPSGVAILQVNSGTNMVSYQVWVANIAPPTRVTIDSGSEAVVQLYPTDRGLIDASGTFTGLLVMGTFAASDLVGPMQGQSISDFVSAMKSEQLNVNALTSSVPNGAINGQIDASTVWENAKLVPMLPVQSLTPNVVDRFLDRLGLDSLLNDPAITNEVLSNLVGRDISSVVWSTPWGGAIISKNNGVLHYGVWAFNVADVTEVTMNEGTWRQTGPVVASLYSSDSDPAVPASSSGVFRGKVIEGNLTESDLVGPAAGSSIADLVKALDSGDIYLTLYSAPNTEGVARGQPFVPCFEVA